MIGSPLHVAASDMGAAMAAVWPIASIALLVIACLVSIEPRR